MYLMCVVMEYGVSGPVALGAALVSCLCLLLCVCVCCCVCVCLLFFQAEDGIRDLVRSRGLGDVYKRQGPTSSPAARKDQRAA